MLIIIIRASRDNFMRVLPPPPAHRQPQDKNLCLPVLLRLKILISIFTYKMQYNACIYVLRLGVNQHFTK